MNAQLLQFGGSLLAITLLVLLAHWLGFSRSARLQSKDEARELLALAPGGFSAIEIALAAEGTGAIARDASGRLAVLKPHGGRFVAQHLPPAIPIEVQGETLRIHTSPPLNLPIGGSAQKWARSTSAAR